MQGFLTEMERMMIRIVLAAAVAALPAGQALANKRAVGRLRSEHGRWVDYVIEFARSIDNLVDFHGLLSNLHRPRANGWSRRLDWYFDVFLQDIKKVRTTEYVKELERYNRACRDHGANGEDVFPEHQVGRGPHRHDRERGAGSGE